MLSRLDEALIWAFARYFKPRKILEIGAGYSTKTFENAIQKNVDSGSERAMHTAIEPFRTSIIQEMPHIKIIPLLLQDVDLSVFQDLEAGDFLFIDSSHVMKPHGDCVLEYLFILPMIKPGVIVHIHDVFLPFDYPAQWYKQKRAYTEQWVLAAFLHGNSDWEVLFATHLMATDYPSIFIENEIEPNGASFWIQRKQY